MNNVLLLIDENKYQDLFKKLNVKYEIKNTVYLNNICFLENNSNNIYIDCNCNNCSCLCCVVDIDYFDIWNIDTIQLLGNTIRNIIHIKNSEIIRENFDEIESIKLDTIYAYFKFDSENSYINSDLIIQYLNINHQLKFCDLYLMIPGYLSNNEVKNIRCYTNDFICNIINKRLEEETDESFIKDIFRLYIGTVDLVIEEDIVEQKRYIQKAKLYLVCHRQTGFCILEIMISNCYIGGNKLNNYYCGNGLVFQLNNYKYNLCELLDLFEIMPFGKKRSLVFSYGALDKFEKINALANEEYVMGKIKGEFAQLAEKDIAIYDTANVYVSSTTMLEHCKELPATIYQRISYQSIELFFVELLLFQDASVDKIYKELKQLQQNQVKSHKYETAIEKLDNINKELTNALIFSDYDYFLFPTTRMSSKRVADAFGLPLILDKYKQNIDILKDLIESNKRKFERKQDNLKNKFLSILTFLSALGTFGEIIYVSENKISPMNAYFMASIIILLVYFVYKIFIYKGEKNDRKANRKNKGKNRD